jgi:hypothetical protein
MTLIGRKLTSLTLVAAAIMAAAALLFGLDLQFESRQQEMLALMSNAVQVRQGDDLARLEGRLVFAVGKPAAARPLRDPDLKIEFDAVSLRRESEIYQWIKHGGKNPRYSADWISAPVETPSPRHPGRQVNRGTIEFVNYADRATDVQVDGVAMDPGFIAGEKERPLPVTSAMFAQLPESIRSRYAVKNGRLVEQLAEPSRNRKYEVVGTNRVAFKAVQPRTGIVFGFMRDGRIVPGQTDQLGVVGGYVPGASDMKSLVAALDRSDDDSHLTRLLATIGLAVLAGGIIFRDFTTAEVVRKQLKFGR